MTTTGAAGSLDVRFVVELDLNQTHGQRGHWTVIPAFLASNFRVGDEVVLRDYDERETWRGISRITHLSQAPYGPGTCAEFELIREYHEESA